MTDVVGSNETPANVLCKSCGLCCTGHLFIWSKLRSAELDAAESLGLNVIREPHQRGFNQPCPLWQGQCTVYTSPNYPRFCHTYRCELLKQVLDENVQLSEALTVVQQTMEMISEVESLLPDSAGTGFRERLVAELENGNAGLDFRLKADKVLDLFNKSFGVDDFL